MTGPRPIVKVAANSQRRCEPTDHSRRNRREQAAPGGAQFNRRAWQSPRFRVGLPTGGA
jgi:hypothetical protein